MEENRSIELNERCRPNVLTKERLVELREIANNSTWVVGWYAHRTEVRGPFCRWLTVSEVLPKYEKHVAERSADALFAAAAMNSLVLLLDRIETLEEEVKWRKGFNDLMVESKKENYNNGTR